MVSQPFTLFTIITGTIAFAYAVTAVSPMLSRLGVVMIVISLGLLLGNLGVVPQHDAAYGPVMGPIIPLSIALLLFRLDFLELRRINARLVLFFLFGSLATVIGTIAAYALFATRIGPDTIRLAGQLCASYIGGGENAVAVAEALGLRADNPTLFSAAFAADNITTAIWMLISLSAPYGLSRIFSNNISSEQLEAARENLPAISASSFLPSAFYSLTLAGVIVWLSALIAEPLKAYAITHHIEWLKFNTTVVWVTTLALVVAQTPLRKHVQISYSLGMFLFLYFFFSMGAISSIHEIAQHGPQIFAFTLTIVGVHAVLVLLVGKALRLDMATIFITSQCNISGPSMAVALAEANGWPHMIVPAILLGVLGYAIANYIGIFVAQVVLVGW